MLKKAQIKNVCGCVCGGYVWTCGVRLCVLIVLGGVLYGADGRGKILKITIFCGKKYSFHCEKDGLAN